MFQDRFIKNFKVFSRKKYDLFVYFVRKDILRSGNKLQRNTHSDVGRKCCLSDFMVPTKIGITECWSDIRWLYILKYFPPGLNHWSTFGLTVLPDLPANFYNNWHLIGFDSLLSLPSSKHFCIKPWQHSIRKVKRRKYFLGQEMVRYIYWHSRVSSPKFRWNQCPVIKHYPV